MRKKERVKMKIPPSQLCHGAGGGGIIENHRILSNFRAYDRW